MTRFFNAYDRFGEARKALTAIISDSPKPSSMPGRVRHVCVGFFALALTETLLQLRELAAPLQQDEYL